MAQIYNGQVANQAAYQQAAASDQTQAQTTYAQIQSDATKQQTERAKIAMDTRTDQQKQMQDMTNNLATTGQKSAEKNDQYIRS